MKLRLAVITAIVALGYGFVLSGNYGQPLRSAVKAGAPVTQRVQVVAETAEGRWIRHVLGEVRVPCQPQRIVTLSAATTDSLIALGITPVLVIDNAWVGQEPLPYQDDLKGVPVVHLVGSTNLETVLSAKPDLIFAGSAQDGRLYDQLSKIAPTVFLPGGEGHFANRESVLLDVGDVVGMSKRAGRRLAEYRKRLDRARETLATVARGQSVMLLCCRERTCTVFTRTTTTSLLLFDDLQLTPEPSIPDAQPFGGWWDVLSLERLSQVRAEHIFVVADPGSEAYLQGIAVTPLWQEIPAVKHGRVHRVASNTWIGAGGVLASESIIRDVMAAMVTERGL